MKKAIQYNLFKENDKFNYSYFSDEELLEILISDEESAQTLIKEHKNLYNVLYLHMPIWTIFLHLRYTYVCIIK